MKKPLLSRKAKTVIYALVALLALTAILRGNFPITHRNAFRLTEKADLIGPSTILGTERVNSLGQDGVIIAKTDKYCMTYAYAHFSYREQNKDKDHILCKEKTGDLTFLSINRRESFNGIEYTQLPIILFDDYPQAVRAALTLSPGRKIGEEFYHQTYAATANRNADGYFLFLITWENQTIIDGSQADPILVESMRKIINAPEFHAGVYENCRIPATVCLYDKYGQLILEREIDLQDPSK